MTNSPKFLFGTTRTSENNKNMLFSAYGEEGLQIIIPN